jgi:hypothetical protein
MLWPTVSRPVWLGVKHPSRVYDQIFITVRQLWFVDVGRSLVRENGSVVYICCWSSPAPTFLGPSPAGLVAIFYCLRFETPPTWRARSPYLYLPGTGWPSYTPRHWVPFSSPTTTRRATMEVFEPASTRVELSNSSTIFSYILSVRTTHRKHVSCVRLRVHWSVGSAGSGADDIENTPHLLLHVGSCLQSCCLATRWSNPLHYCGSTALCLALAAFSFSWSLHSR